MELRAWIAFANFPPPDDEKRWESFFDALQDVGGELGPVLGGGGGVTEVVVSADADDYPGFVAEAVGCVADALRAAGLYRSYPAKIEVERVPADELMGAR